MRRTLHYVRRNIDGGDMATQQDQIDAFAAVKAKAEDFIGQREQFVGQLIEMRDTATALLEKLGSSRQNGSSPAFSSEMTAVVAEPEPPARRTKRKLGRPQKATVNPETGRRPLSAAEKKSISKRMKKYWAAQRAVKKALR